MVTVAEYLFQRIKELGINDIFGVPGDYNLSFVDILYHNKKLTWRGTCNELNASYAADGYARVNGFSALITTYGVGELSAINGIAGAYAEQVPIIHIVGGPSLVKQSKQLNIHHSLVNGKFDAFSHAYKNVTKEQITLNFNNAAQEIDRIISIAYKYRYPVYIRLPEDVAVYKIPPPTAPLELRFPSSEQQNLDSYMHEVINKINSTQKICVLIGEEVARYQIEDRVRKFIEKMNYPFSSVWGVKGVINENHPNYIGLYRGQLSDKKIHEFIEQSATVISIGVSWDEFNTAGFTMNIPPKNHIELHSVHSSIHGNKYHFVSLFDVLDKIESNLTPYQGHIIKYDKKSINHICSGEITQNKIIDTLRSFIGDHDHVVVDTGTSLFNSGELELPNESRLIISKIWASIGYATPATLGVCLASKKSKRTILITGDGAYQMTAQSLSSMFFHEVKPIVFLINNGGYTIERMFHGPEASYNDIQPWNYQLLTKLFGGDAFTTKVSNMDELTVAMHQSEIENKNKLCFIEVILNKNDQPKTLLDFVKIIRKKH